MPIPEDILRDLASGQSTADSIAGRLRIETDHCEGILRRLLAEGFVANHPIQIDGKDALLVYRLTAKPIL